MTTMTIFIIHNNYETFIIHGNYVTMAIFIFCDNYIYINYTWQL